MYAVQAPVRVFVAALVSSGLEGDTDNVIAAELTVPMLCVGKRYKVEKNSAGVVIKMTDYIKEGMKKLGYAEAEWTDEVARLYDQDS